MNIVWLKKDLRLTDHAPFYFAAAAQQPFVVLYCFEPALQAADSFDLRHWWAAWQSLVDMQHRLATYGLPLYIAYADAITVLAHLHKHQAIRTIWSHQETGIALTYERDQAVAQFCVQNGITWHQYAAEGIERGLKNRQGWDQRRRQTLRQATYEPNFQLAVPAAIQPDNLPTADLPPDISKPAPPFVPDPDAPALGETAAWQWLHHLAQQYNQAKPSRLSQLNPTAPLTDAHLSAYLAYGNLSLRQILHFIRQQPHNRYWTTLSARLLQRNDLIQQFEMDWRMERENLNFAFNGIRIKQNETYLAAWKSGTTGFPLIDAAMRCVRQTGYLPFRLRAATVAFLTQHLWLDWRKGGAAHLAQMLLDFEAGVHYPNCQQQALCTGSTAEVRVADPVKQARTLDPDAAFIRHWLPELRSLPPQLCHAPWLMTDLEQQLYGFQMGKDYPLPIIQYEQTQIFATTELNRVCRSLTAQRETARIKARYASIAS